MTGWDKLKIRKTTFYEESQMISTVLSMQESTIAQRASKSSDFTSLIRLPCELFFCVPSPYETCCDYISSVTIFRTCSTS